MARFMVEYAPQIPIKVLSQCGGAGIDLYVNYVNIVLSRNFKLSVQGQRNVNSALNNLPVYFSADERLTFGWTLEHALRNRGVHESSGGYEHLALEAVLSEAFSEAYASKVLHEMAAAYADQSDVIPHLSQWRGLVQSSSGIFASTEFGQLVEDYIRLNPHDVSAQEALEDSRNLPRPKLLSLALGMLAQVTNQHEKRMTIVGGPIIGWFAAVAEWLFGLRLAIYSSSGERLCNNPENQDAQVLLVYDDKPGLHAQIESWKLDSDKAEEVAIRPRLDTENIRSVHVGGRVVWNSLLSQIFGANFHHLDHEENKTLGLVIGCAARILKGLAEENSFADTSRHNVATFGVGLVRTLPDWLPELRRTQARMERQLKLSFEEARQTYFEQIQKLQDICGCNVCASGNVAASASSTQDLPQGYCLPVLAETFIALGVILSNATVSSAIYPMRPGMENFYVRQVAKKRESRNFDVSDIRHFQTVYGNVWNVPDAIRLQNLAEIFSGSRPTAEVPENIVALTHEGMCVYLVKLEKSERSTRPENDGLIRVVSGAICVRQKVFRRACLGPVADADELENVWEEVSCEHLSHPLYCK
jgi:hypothetical protein